MAANDEGSKLAGVIGLMLGMTWIFFSLRIYVRTCITKGLRVDDLLLIVSIIFFTIYCACHVLAIKYGVGGHTTDTSLDNLSNIVYFSFLSKLFYILTTVFVRLSIAVFLIRICLERIYRIIIKITMTIVVVFSIFFFFFVLFQCSPVDTLWNQFKGEQGHCMYLPLRDTTIAHSVVSFTADWVLGLLPIALCWSLQINQRTKISLIAILALGPLAGVATIIRIPYLLLSPDDFVYRSADIGLCCTIEAGLGIFAASAYTLRPLFRSFLSDSSRWTPGYPTSETGARRAGYVQNNANPPSHIEDSSSEAPGQNLGIPLSVDPMDASSHVASLFSDSANWGRESEWGAGMGDGKHPGSSDV
ncbi:hypothetical protein OIDMADRAFT_181770 [Oidiodendron maius Zn]|uniref:Rhodopsin domain-containing protein n=1 Tax=Oidiodendron maius (strain Zn) TaxID=913774 RepID=A0A0C3CH83_OIDMZ|nr:hypothetical protein OIDMADRAFT_181770 [Oidiodendron maius Zn]